MPVVTDDIIRAAKSSRALTVENRAKRLFDYLVLSTQTIGEAIEVALPSDESVDPSKYAGSDDVPESVCNLWRAMAWSESTTIAEVDFLIDCLTERGWLYRNHRRQPESVRVTIDGHAQIEGSRMNIDRRQVFVAMWFDDETNDAFNQGIQPAIESVGYTTMRIDRKEHINKIDDEIVAEIRRSRFLIADYTQGQGGARGGVYWEDGFATGLDIQVIRTCREDCKDKIAFDTRQYNHIFWETPDALRQALQRRILEVFGEGPNATS